MASSYSQGYDEATLKSHASRSAEKQADYLLEHIKSNAKVLDVGCGPGTITCDFVRYAPEGQIHGVDSSPEVISQAVSNAKERNADVSFEVANAHELPFPDQSFDIVHCHALLVHLPNPINALREMYRVCKPGGYVGIREPDMDTCVIHPHFGPIEQASRVQDELKRREGAEPNAGRFLATWAHEAGFAKDKMQTSCNLLSYSGRDEIKWWGELYAKRLRREVGKRSVEYGLASEEDVEAWAAAYQEWSRCDLGLFAMLHVRLLARK